LKKALEPILPRDILYRSKKGFGVPIGSWFKSGAVGLPTRDLPGAIRSTSVTGWRITVAERQITAHSFGALSH
jgi:asparagine synthase (glutamine-hydrolysing)